MNSLIKLKIFSFQDIGNFCLCGDFNARCGNLQDLSKEDKVTSIPDRLVTDRSSPNSHGKAMVDFIKCTNLCMLNGRSKHGCEFTSVSTKGLAVVDYCLVPTVSLPQFSDFKVLDILNLADEFMIADHSLLTWSVAVRCTPSLSHCQMDNSSTGNIASAFRKMPDQYLKCELVSGKFQDLCHRVDSARHNGELDTVYDDFCELLESELTMVESNQKA